MKKATCLAVHTCNGKAHSYELMYEDEDFSKVDEASGSIDEISKKDLKDQIASGKLEVSNIKLTRTGKLVVTDEIDEVAMTKQEIAKMYIENILHKHRVEFKSTPGMVMFEINGSTAIMNSNRSGVRAGIELKTPLKPLTMELATNQTDAESLNNFIKNIIKIMK